MLDEHTSMMASRAEVRDRIDVALDEAGAKIAAVVEGRPPAEVDRELWVNDPGNEQGAAGLMALAQGGPQSP